MGDLHKPQTRREIPADDAGGRAVARRWGDAVSLAAAMLAVACVAVTWHRQGQHHQAAGRATAGEVVQAASDDFRRLETEMEAKGRERRTLRERSFPGGLDGPAPLREAVGEVLPDDVVPAGTGRPDEKHMTYAAAGVRVTVRKRPGNTGTGTNTRGAWEMTEAAELDTGRPVNSAEAASRILWEAGK